MQQSLPALHSNAYRSSASRYCTVSLRSFSARCLGCTHLFFSLEAAGIRSTSRREVFTIMFYFVYSTMCIYHLQYAICHGQTLRLTKVLVVSLSFKNWLSPRIPLPVDIFWRPFENIDWNYTHVHVPTLKITFFFVAPQGPSWFSPQASSSIQT